MRTPSGPALLAALACGLVSASALAENTATIDDFSSGHYQSKALKKGSETSTQAGTMTGGMRTTTLTLCSTHCTLTNPFGLVTSYGYVAKAGQAGTNAFVQSAGFEVQPRIVQEYSPADADLSLYDRVRVNFVGLTQPLNFNVQMFTGIGGGQNGCNLDSSNVAFSVEFPFAYFTSTNGGFIPSDITGIDLIYQSGSLISGVEFAISSIVVSDTAQPGAIVCKLAGN